MSTSHHPLLKILRTFLCVLLIISVQINHLAYAQAVAGCDKGLTAAVDAVADNKIKNIEKRKMLHDKMVDVAMDCITQMMKILNMIAFPTFPTLTDGLIDKLMLALMNKACKIVVAKVGDTLKPLTDLSQDAQLAIDGVVGTANEKFNKETGNLDVKLAENGEKSKVTASKDSEAAAKTTAANFVAPIANAAEGVKAATDRLNTTLDRLQCGTVGGYGCSN